MTARGKFAPRVTGALPEVFENPCVGAGAIRARQLPSHLLGCSQGGEHRAFWDPVTHADERRC